MPLRTLAVLIIILLFLSVEIYGIYIRARGEDEFYTIHSRQKWIGVIDMDSNHSIDMHRILEGKDIILVADIKHRFFQEIFRRVFRNPLAPFEIAEFDFNLDGILNSEDPIYHPLYVIVFDPEKQRFEIKSLMSAGIRGIKVKPLSQDGDYTVILSDGSTRTLYEINSPGGTTIHVTPDRRAITHTP